MKKQSKPTNKSSGKKKTDVIQAPVKSEPAKIKPVGVKSTETKPKPARVEPTKTKSVEVKVKKGFDYVPGLIFIVITAIVLLFSRGVFVSNDAAVEIAEANGYTNVVIENRDWFMLGGDDCGIGLPAARFNVKVTDSEGTVHNRMICTNFPFEGITSTEGDFVATNGAIVH